MTRLSESDELAAAKWLLQQGYVQAVGTYKMYGKDCNLLALAPGPGTGIELIDFDEEEVAGV